MALTLDRARQMADQLCMELLSRSGDVDRATRYYRGEQPLRFASSEFKEYFGKRYAHFADNWVQVVADAPVERLTVTGVVPYGAEEADDDSWRVWQENGLDVDSQLAFLGAGNGARSFALVWGNPDDEETPVVTFEDASQAIVAYRAGSRRDRVAALKWWQDGSIEYATLYTADELWKFQRSLSKTTKSGAMAEVDDEVREWELRDTGDEPNPQPNPMGVVPMVELPNRPLLVGDPVSDVLGVIAMQDAINLLWAQLLTAADYASFKQRLILGAEMPKIPILNAAGEVVGEKPVDLKKFAADRVLWIEDENAKIAEWDATDLANYTNVLEVAVGHIAAQTRTPSHYLIGKISNLSSDALIAAETGLVKKAEEKHLWYGGGLREMYRLIALAQHDENKARALSAGTVLWKDAETRNRAQLADSLMKLKTIGFPFEWLAAQYGLTPPEITNLMAMRERDSALDPISQVMNGKPDLTPPPDTNPNAAPVDVGAGDG